MEEENEEEQSKVETIHIQSNTCNCAECQEKRSKYVTILDVDRYIESLNGKWHRQLNYPQYLL